MDPDRLYGMDDLGPDPEWYRETRAEAAPVPPSGGSGVLPGDTPGNPAAHLTAALRVTLTGTPGRLYTPPG